MNTVREFQEGQQKSIEILRSLGAFLKQGENLGVEIGSSFFKKIEAAILDINSDKLKIALVGGFSEGKTSIAAAWLGKLDKKTMKISEQESSNEVAVYEVPGEPIVIFDTPGLFGFKSQINSDSQAVEKYKDITRKYVSEAHIILYVMNSKNPIKDSHIDELKWLFRDLNLLPRTIFVLSRFDEVADVEDEDDYQYNLKIKKENIIDRLEQAIDLTHDEKKALDIIAVSANPFNIGAEKWLENMDEFKKLSHIKLLQKATSENMKKNGGLPAIIYQTQKSVIRDVIGKQMPVILEKNQQLISEIATLENSKKRLIQDLKELDKNVNDAKKNLQENIISYFSRLIRKVRGCSIETLQSFVTDEIGEEGCIINTRVQQFFDEATDGVSIEISKIKTQLAGEVQHYNSAMSTLGVKGVNFLVNNVKFTNSTILAGRNFLKLPIKFKPWGAVKFAKGLNSGLIGLGFALELWDSYKSAKREEEFQIGINNMADNFSQQQKELLDVIKDPDFNMQYFPEYISFTNHIKEIDSKLLENKKYQEDFTKWCNIGKSIENDFNNYKN